MPQIVNAILSRHNFILLGLRGQAKTRILRALSTLLDEAMPIVAGSEVNDNPFAPISQVRAQPDRRGGRRHADRVGRPRQRYVEKLATPDVTIADLIGDVDPIKAARGGHMLSDELTIHFGMLPRANRGIFALNELPDLAGKIQVGLFNIMQEGDVQIKGYPIRLPLDVLLCFTANPEDYTARGKIITPLKDRIGSEIITHYPETRRARDGDHRAGSVDRARQPQPVRVPDFIAEVVERIAFEARDGQAHRQALRRLAAHADHGDGERRLQRRAARDRHRRRRRSCRASPTSTPRCRRSPARSSSSTRASSSAATRSRAS